MPDYPGQVCRRCSFCHTVMPRPRLAVAADTSRRPRRSGNGRWCPGTHSCTSNTASAPPRLPPCPRRRWRWRARGGPWCLLTGLWCASPQLLATVPDAVLAYPRERGQRIPTPRRCATTPTAGQNHGVQVLIHRSPPSAPIKSLLAQLPCHRRPTTGRPAPCPANRWPKAHHVRCECHRTAWPLSSD